MGFGDHIDRAVEAHLCDDAAYRAQGVGPLVQVRIMIDRPTELERLQGMGFARARPVLSASVESIPDLRTGDTIHEGRWVGEVFSPAASSWRLAEAPTRPGDGRWWRGEVEPL